MSSSETHRDSHQNEHSQENNETNKTTKIEHHKNHSGEGKRGLCTILIVLTFFLLSLMFWTKPNPSNKSSLLDSAFVATDDPPTSPSSFTPSPPQAKRSEIKTKSNDAKSINNKNNNVPSTSPQQKQTSVVVYNNNNNSNNGKSILHSIFSKKSAEESCHSLIQGADAFTAQLVRKVSVAASSTKPLPAPCASEDSTEFEKSNCAATWLKKCWHPMKTAGGDGIPIPAPSVGKSSTLKSLNECDPLWMREYVGTTLHLPKKDYVWRELGVSFFASAKTFLSHDEFVVRAECEDIKTFSKKLCLSFVHRELGVVFRQKNANDVVAIKNESDAEGENQPTPFTQGRLTSALIHDQFALFVKDPQKQTTDSLMMTNPADNNNNINEAGYKIKILESFEFHQEPILKGINDHLSKNRKNKRRITEIDLVISGMFLHNVSFMANRWEAAEGLYYSKYEFRNRHFFQWNSVRDARLRLAKAKRLYGDNLKKRMDTLRNEVIHQRYRTWLTFDINSGKGDLKIISELFSQLLVLRYLGASYLFSLDQEEKQKTRRDFRNELADYLVWTRPDLSFHVNRIVLIARRGEAEAEAVHVRGKHTMHRGAARRVPAKDFFLRSDVPTNFFIGHQLPGSDKILKYKMNDVVIVANASGLIHIYRFLPSVLHSCLYVPVPSDYFVEFFIKIGSFDFYKMKYIPLQFGVWIERGIGIDLGNKTTMPPKVNVDAMD